MQNNTVMKTVQGISASPGIAIGTVCLYSSDIEGSIPHYLVSPDQVEHEIKRVSSAFLKTEKSIAQMVERSKKTSDHQAEEIFIAHLAILKDPGLLKKITDLIQKNTINAEHAVSDIFQTYIERYKKSKGHFAELVHDLTDIRDDILDSFGVGKGHFVCEIGDTRPVIIVSKTLVPSMLMEIPREHVLAFVTEEGGYTTHATILARSYGVPVIFGVKITDIFNCGDQAIVDGSMGKLVLHPDEKTLEYYQFRLNKIKERRLLCSSLKGFPSKTKEGEKITLKVNISVPFEMTFLKDSYYDGIGLLRTEFLFQGHEPPSEEVQYQEYKNILDEAGSREVVIRLLDIGPDKLPPYMSLPPQTNPDLGIRGARAVEYFFTIYLTQAKALIRASEHGNLKLLLPMVSDLGDLFIYRKLLQEAHTQLNNHKKNYKTGIMIETPSSALLAESFLKEVDFVNIGSNDLLQYTLAASRGNAYTENRYHIVHPALMRLIELVVKAARKSHKEVCLCGEIASFDEFYPVFLAVGLRSFSVAVPKYEEIKCALSFLDTNQSSTILKKFYNAQTKDQIEKLFH